MDAQEKKVVVVYYVKYKPNGRPLIDGQKPFRAGRHGEFAGEEGEEHQALAEAEAAVVKCKRYFNEVKTLKIRSDQDDDDFLHGRNDYTTEQRDEFDVKTNEIVHVWIDEWRGGKLVKNGDPTCEPKSNVQTEHSGTSLPESKSPNASTESGRQKAVA